MTFDRVSSVWAVLFLSLAIGVSGLAAQTNSFSAPVDTEKSTQAFLAPKDAARKIELLPGFKATLFAGEPDVRQPIAFTTDDRGRLWVAENYTYSDNGRFDSKLRDRIVIFEDDDNDGDFDKRTVFWDKGQQLTSVAVGFGGVWVLCAPRLLFIPDRNHDDIPDGEPEVLLDGWETKDIQHNIVNGLMWGPDGWLYGRHGILATSAVGKPGTPESERSKINCGIWRYHPTRKTFEVVAHGTTNPWGMDFDEHGEAFFINTVTGHLWHLIPGAHYKRMYGQDMSRHSYELIDQHADHYHWDTGQVWTESRSGKGLNDTLGGGHAHSGLMIYNGDNWPDRYRNSIFTVNLHGYRLNNDLLERRGSGYVGKHGADIFKTSDIWFRAVDLAYGADGGVFVADWSDTGECHEADGVHRSSGRIFKLTYGNPPHPSIANVSNLEEGDLIKALFHKNHWIARHAQRVLQERSAAGERLPGVAGLLRNHFEKQTGVPAKLRAMWALHAINGASKSWLFKQLGHDNEYVRVWAVRFLTEDKSGDKTIVDALTKSSKSDPSPAVRLAIASALQRLPMKERAVVAAGLLSHGEDSKDHNLPLMTWYGIAPLGDSAPLQLVELSGQTKIPLIRKLIARRLAENLEKNSAPLDALVTSVSKAGEEFQKDTVQGMTEGLRGWREADAPRDWSLVRESVERGSNQKLKDMVRNLSLVFGDEAIVAQMKRAVLDENADVASRRSTLNKLIESKRADFLPFLQSLATNLALAPAVAGGLAAYDDPNAAALILQNYAQLPPKDRPDVVSVLVSRPGYADALLDEVAAGKILRQDISAYHARQITSLGNKTLNAKLSKTWGEIRKAGQEKEQLIAKYKAALTPARIKKANLSAGREIFNMACALCHKLYGNGATIGPDLTGSGRSNLDYLLENILDPSGIVAADFKMVVVTLKDGRVLNGVVSAQSERTISIQSFTENTTLERTEIVEMKPSDTSLMPEGLLESLDETQTADLISYLMSAEQVPLPQEKK